MLDAVWLLIHHYTEKILNVGVMKMNFDCFTINVYDVERSVCDAVKFKNKIGTDVCSEIISNYLEVRKEHLETYGLCKTPQSTHDS